MCLSLDGHILCMCYFIINQKHHKQSLSAMQTDAGIHFLSLRCWGLWIPTKNDLWCEEAHVPRNCSNKAGKNPSSGAELYTSSTNVNREWRPPSDQYHTRNLFQINHILYMFNILIIKNDCQNSRFCVVCFYIREIIGKVFVTQLWYDSESSLFWQYDCIVAVTERY